MHSGQPRKDISTVTAGTITLRCFGYLWFCFLLRLFWGWKQ